MRILIFLLTSLLSACNATNNAQSTEITNPKLFADDDFKSIPVRIHVLKSSNAQNLNAKISHNEAVDVFNIVNLIWRQAGIHFEIESIVNLKASNENQYVAARKRNDRNMKVMRGVCDIPKQSKGVLNLCVVGQMSNNSGGVYFKSSKPKVVWPSRGKKPLNPATLAHEFGHFLGLPHNTEKDIFLMRGGGNNMRRNKRFNMIQFTESEIVKSRKMATKLFH
ncbi:zinc-dependent metalloprotease family protein [Alteromonas sp. A081]|uniref:zinc-dependent metalloprotease family protein n=1 Tax=Alteromonas sp. A081 TaxID=3410269 RepID=UPI003B983FE5